jgi:hypothetical protein
MPLQGPPASDNALFTGVRGIGILRTSPFGDSRKLGKLAALRQRSSLLCRGRRLVAYRGFHFQGTAQLFSRSGCDASLTVHLRHHAGKVFEVFVYGWGSKIFAQLLDGGLAHGPIIRNPIAEPAPHWYSTQYSAPKHFSHPFEEVAYLPRGGVQALQCHHVVVHEGVIYSVVQ